METYVILRRSGWKTPDELGESGKRSGEVGDEMADDIYWLRTYAVEEENGMLGTVCIYKASGPDAIREHAERVGMPATEIMPVGDTLIIHADPE
jgi:hypothetical protein